MPDEWQEIVVSDWLATRADGKWTASRCGLSVPRQNGKNGALEIVELFKLVALGRKILHTAHEVKTARKAFLRLCSFFENERMHPELAAMLDGPPRKTNGQEAIYLRNGGSIEFIARSKGSGRGFTVDDLVMDEAQSLDDFAYAALVPTISAAPSGNPQQIVTGTPPGPKDDGEVFTRMRSDALARRGGRSAWHEWAFDADSDFDDERQWAKANPALGIRLDAETIRDERAAMDDETFGRERGGLWDDAGTRRVIDAEMWRVQRDEASRAVADLSLAIDTDPDQAWTSVSFAGRRADGSWHVELFKQASGMMWAVSEVVERVQRNTVRSVVIDGMSAAVALVQPLADAGVTVTVTGSREMASACGGMFAGLVTGDVWHIGQPQLDSAAGAVRKRPIGDAFGWSRKNAASDITSFVSCTLALWGSTSSNVKRPTSRRGSGRVVVFS